MSKIKLVQSGGIMGRSKSAEMEIDMTENDLYDALMEIRKGKNPLARDTYTYTVHIGNEPVEDGICISIGKAKGKLKSALNSLMKELKT